MDEIMAMLRGFVGIAKDLAILPVYGSVGTMANNMAVGFGQMMPGACAPGALPLPQAQTVPTPTTSQPISGQAQQQQQPTASQIAALTAQVNNLTVALQKANII